MKNITRQDEIIRTLLRGLEDIASEDQTRLHTSAIVLQEIARYTLKEYKNILDRGVVE